MAGSLSVSVQRPVRFQFHSLWMRATALIRQYSLNGARMLRARPPHLVAALPQAHLESPKLIGPKLIRESCDERPHSLSGNRGAWINACVPG